MTNKTKTGIFFFFLIVLFLPLLQKAFSFVNSGELYGVYKVAPDLDFSWKGWFDGSYELDKGKYLNDNMGFRPDLLRVNNQLDFSMFRKIHSEWKLFTDHGCVFLDADINSYVGTDYNGYPYVLEKVRKMKAIQDTMQKLGKSFIFALATGKAFYYPEYLPDSYKKMRVGATNFEAYKRIGDSLGLNQVDLNTYLVSMKQTGNELLFPKQGNHWSEYGALLAADSLISYLEQLRSIRMIHPVWTKVEHTNEARYSDDDIAKTLNLISPITTETFSYPDIKFTGDKTAVKPKIIFVGDSFLFQWVNDGVMYECYKDWQILHYNETLINKDHDSRSWFVLKGYNYAEQLNNADGVVVIFTTRNLNNMGRNFIEQVYSRYYPSK